MCFIVLLLLGFSLEPFYGFNYSVSWYVSHWAHLVWRVLCASWTWISVSFPRLRMFLATISLNRFSVPFFLFFLSAPYNANVTLLDSALKAL